MSADLYSGHRIGLKSSSATLSQRSRSGGTVRATEMCMSSIASQAGWSLVLPCATIGRCSCLSSLPMLIRFHRGSISATQKTMLCDRFSDGTWECPDILGELDRTHDLYFDRVSQIKIDKWSRGRVALVGDAAFCVSLMAGQGAALAMTAAYVVAGELADAHGRHEKAFGNYEMLMRSYIGSKQRGAQRFCAASVPKDSMGAISAQSSDKGLRDSGLARRSFGRDIIDTLRLPDYAWPALAPTGT